MRRIISILILVALGASALAQTRVIFGKLTVYDAYPVQNVLVKAKKSKSAVKTDSLGLFSIVCQETDVIRIKPKAFRPVTMRVGPDTDSLTINLYFLDSRKNRELAVGYGYVKEKDLLYAVSNLEQADADFCIYNDIFELMTGRFAGVTVNSGAVFIRGISSLTGSNEALYVVDGMIYSSIEWVVPCEIKSINILKDSSAAIYGSRGSNGVVLIETKTGNQ